MTILCVDLDGTLIRNDTTWLATKEYLRARPFACWRLLTWILRGRAYYKQRLGQFVNIDPKTLPYHHELLQWLIERKQQGDTLVLATATDQVFANIIANHLNLFDQVIASDGCTNLRAQHKAAALTRHFGLKKYCYIGNSYDDLHVWREAQTAIVVNASQKLQKRVRDIIAIERIFD